MSRVFFTFAFLVFFAAPAFAGFSEGRDAYNRGDWAQAILHLRPLVEEGNAKAAVLMGNMYAEGYGVGKDAREAFLLYRKAALQNNADGMIAIATFYQQGLGVPKNMRLAVAWFERAARLGYQPGAFFYAIHLYQGFKSNLTDIQPDHPQAYKWFRVTERFGDSKNLQEAARKISTAIAAKLAPEKVTEMDLEAAAFKPVDPANLGPPPEEALIEELKEKELPPRTEKSGG